MLNFSIFKKKNQNKNPILLDMGRIEKESRINHVIKQWIVDWNSMVDKSEAGNEEVKNVKH